MEIAYRPFAPDPALWLAIYSDALVGSIQVKGTGENKIGADF